MSDAWSYLSGSGDAWERLGGTSGDAWFRLPGTIGDAWERLTTAIEPTEYFPVALLAQGALYDPTIFEGYGSIVTCGLLHPIDTYKIPKNHPMWSPIGETVDGQVDTENILSVPLLSVQSSLLAITKVSGLDVPALLGQSVPGVPQVQTGSTYQSNVGSNCPLFKISFNTEYTAEYLTPLLQETASIAAPLPEAHVDPLIDDIASEAMIYAPNQEIEAILLPQAISGRIYLYQCIPQRGCGADLGTPSSASSLLTPTVVTT